MANNANKKIKCVVWDLDNTLWEGTLLEDRQVAIKPEMIQILNELDRRGILLSISSKNDHNHAEEQLMQFGVYDYFLYPEINWNPKSQSIKAIAEQLNIGLDTFAFIDDQGYERDEVAHSLPQVLCLDAADVSAMLQMPEFIPAFITEETGARRKLYQADIIRKQAEELFEGTSEDFLATLGMEFTISSVTDEDLHRAEELTVRTNQLNSTGQTYSYEQLEELIQSPRHKLLKSSLKDKYGDYGVIGLSLLTCDPGQWTINLLLMSCRVMSRGVGTMKLNYILDWAKRENVRLLGDFVETDRNRMMLVSYRFAGFRELIRNGNQIVMEHNLSFIQPPPNYVKLIVNV